MYSAHEMDELGSVVLELAGIVNRPDRDDLLLAEAGVSLDRALFPHLVRLSVRGPTAVAELAAEARGQAQRRLVAAADQISPGKGEQHARRCRHLARVVD